MYRNPGIALTSITQSGAMMRYFITRRSETPPAISRAPSGFAAKAEHASLIFLGAKYSNFGSAT
jgi:hypothetical protein